MGTSWDSVALKVAACVTAAGFLGLGRAYAARPFISQSAIYAARDGGYFAHRIPALLATGNGTLLAFCEARAGSASDSAPADLVLRRSLDNGMTWNAAQVVARFAGFTVGNPTPVEDAATGIIWLLMTANPAGLTEKEIDGGSPGGERTVWITHSSDDHGKTWKTGGSAGPETNESAVVELADGSLLLNMRSYAGKHQRAVALSHDGGLTWSPVQLDPALIEPVCQASMIRYSLARAAGRNR